MFILNKNPHRRICFWEGRGCAGLDASLKTPLGRWGRSVVVPLGRKDKKNGTKPIPHRPVSVGAHAECEPPTDGESGCLWSESPRACDW